MGTDIPKTGLRTWLTLGFAVWVMAVGSAIGSAPPPQRTPPPAQNQKAAAVTTKAMPGAGAEGQSYVGEAKCLGLPLRAATKGYEGSPHHRVADPRTPAAKQSCETCHGPGSEHVDDPATYPVKDFKKLPADDVNATCTTCHNRGEHALWDGSQHESASLACTTCHTCTTPSRHQAAQGEDAARRSARRAIATRSPSSIAPGTCRCAKARCSARRATTCTARRTCGCCARAIRSAELCTSCHADKRGPFLWEHAPSRDGCVTCHDPHGSSNERMLVAKPPILCQRCHVGTRHPSTIYDAALIGSSGDPSVRIYAPVVRDLPLGDPRVESSERPAVHSVRGAARHAYRHHIVRRCACSRSGSRGRAQARPPAEIGLVQWRADRLRRARDEPTAMPHATSAIATRQRSLLRQRSRLNARGTAGSWTLDAEHVGRSDQRLRWPVRAEPGEVQGLRSGIRSRC